jgi:ABC-type dipeptide/oligopeptide/nickel transport system permease subunit
VLSVSCEFWVKGLLVFCGFRVSVLVGFESVVFVVFFGFLLGVSCVYCLCT